MIYALIATLIAVALIVSAFYLARKLWVRPHSPVVAMRYIYLGGVLDTVAVVAVIAAVYLWVIA